MNGLNLAVNAGSPTITVDQLGGGAVTTIDAVLNGNSGLIKAGTGTLALTRPNTIAGPLTVSRGTLRIGPGGSLSASTLTVAGNISALHIAGGTFAASGLTTLTPRNSEIVIDSGVARFDGGVTCTNTRDAIFRIRGGNVSAASIDFPRTSDATINFGSGLLVQGGATVIGPIGLGTGNSWGVMSVESGSIEVTGPLTVGHQVTSGRGGAFRVTGGEFRVTDTEFGVIMSRNPGTNPNNVSQGSFLGGVSIVEKFTLGFDPTVTAGSVTITINGGTVYLGSGGIVKNGSAGLATNLNFISGLVGAKAGWSTSLPIALPANGNIVIKAADAANVARDITLDGALTGAGGFTKIGSGRLRLGAANTFSGPVTVDSGLLEVSGSLGPGSDVTINSGGVLTGTGALARAVTLNPGGALSFGNANPGSSLKVESVRWNAGGVMVFRLGSTSSQLAVKGNLIKGDAGVRRLHFKGEAGLAPGESYTLVTFGSTDLMASDITISGLPTSLTGVLRVLSNSIVLDVIGRP
jgi:autotransporter-associated beta strand protein